jgi:hypothetical protein
LPFCCKQFKEAGFAIRADGELSCAVAASGATTVAQALNSKAKPVKIKPVFMAVMPKLQEGKRAAF